MPPLVRPAPAGYGCVFFAAQIPTTTAKKTQPIGIACGLTG